ncbi:putative MFS family arabinose efflux permease [Kribbella steppae]|uniref:Putative MFS family arabinose efflux permease n=1 Tax=Kribbella steppae TaxID=2512223 RepID=A0A4R2HHE4_9ACTN|nr:MFS transporter [Kribbella steppae]TCO26393.1 putative MFS family arabinose efflux permease [Kribbella steppae]
MSLSSRAPSLWADRDFLMLWIGQSASLLATHASQVTLPLVAVVSLGAGAAQLGGLRAAQQLPILLFSLFVGVLVDRWRARTMMVYADFGRAVLLGLVPIAWTLGLPFLYVVAFVSGVFSVCFDVAYQASFPRLVRRDQLAQGNSILESSKSAAQISGPALGGGLVSLLTAPFAVLASAFFFVISFLSIWRIRGLDTAPVAPSGGVLRQIRDGLKVVVDDGSLRAVAIATCVYQFFFTALMTVYLLFLSRSLELPGAAMGIVLAAFGPGALVGSLLSGWMPRWFGYGRVVVFAALISDLVMLCTSFLHGSGAATIAALIAINFLYGVFSQTVDVAVMAIRQAVTPQAIQGRVVATINFLGLGLTPLGALLGGLAAGLMGIRLALTVAIAGLFLSPLSLSLSPLRRLGSRLPSCS